MPTDRPNEALRPPFYPDDENRGCGWVIVTVLIALLIAFGALAYWWFGFAHQTHSMSANHHIALGTSGGGLLPPTPAHPPRPAPTTRATPQCPLTKRDRLAETRKERVSDMYERIEHFVRLHKLTPDQAVSLKGLVHDYPDGEMDSGMSYQIVDDEVTVWWRGKYIPAVLRGLESRTICSCAVHSTIYFSPRQKIIVRQTFIPPVIGCYSIEFTAPVGTVIKWGYDSSAGSLPPECNTQRQGNGPVETWVNDACGEDCLPPADYVEEILHRSVTVRRFYSYMATAEQQMISLNPLVRFTSIHLCLTYPDGASTNFVYVDPTGTRTPDGRNFVNWNGRHHLRIPSGLWTVDDGTALDEN